MAGQRARARATSSSARRALSSSETLLPDDLPPQVPRGAATVRPRLPGAGMTLEEVKRWYVTKVAGGRRAATSSAPPSCWASTGARSTASSSARRPRRTREVRASRRRARPRWRRGLSRVAGTGVGVASRRRRPRLRHRGRASGAQRGGGRARAGPARAQRAHSPDPRVDSSTAVRARGRRTQPGGVRGRRRRWTVVAGRDVDHHDAALHSIRRSLSRSTFASRAATSVLPAHGRLHEPRSSTSRSSRPQYLDVPPARLQQTSRTLGDEILARRVPVGPAIHGGKRRRSVRSMLATESSR